MAMTPSCATAAAVPRQQRRIASRLTNWSIFLLAVGLLLARGFLKRRNSNVPAQEDLPLAYLGVKEVEVYEEVEKFFPGARTGIDVMRRTHKALAKYGINKGNTLYGQSVCSDEINGDHGHLTALMTQYYGRTFPLGGIGGLPYVGKTGFGAFSHHVQDNGNVLIVFGPHIGFSMEGDAGKFLRRGQAAPSTACGANIAAYNQCLDGGYFVAHDRQDMQQSRLRRLLKPHFREVSEAPNPMVALVYQVYKAVESEMMKIINTDFGPGKLVLLGGIQINMPHPMRGRFLPLHFTIRSKTEAPINLLDWVFKD